MKDKSGLYLNGNLLVNAPFSAKWSWIGDKENSNLFQLIVLLKILLRCITGIRVMQLI